MYPSCFALGLLPCPSPDLSWALAVPHHFHVLTDVELSQGCTSSVPLPGLALSPPQGAIPNTLFPHHSP